MVSAKLTHKGQTQPVEVSSLTPTSAFVHTGGAFQYRDALTLELFGHPVAAEVVYTATTPPLGVGLVLSPSVEAKRAIVAHLSSPAPPPAPPPAPASTPAPAPAEPLAAPARPAVTPPPRPRREAGAWLEIGGAELTIADPWLRFAVGAALAAGRAVPVRGAAGPVVLSLFGARVSAEVTAAAGSGGATEGSAADAWLVAPDPQVLRGLFGGAPPEPPAAAAVPPDQPPELVGDRIEFKTVAQYRHAYGLHVEKGAIAAQAEPLPAGTKRRLRVVVPGAAPVDVEAAVAFASQGVVGFIIEGFAGKKGELAQLRDGGDPTARSSIPPRASVAVGPEFRFHGRVAPGISPRQLWTFTADPPAAIEAADGSLTRLLAFLVRRQASGVLDVSDEASRARLSVWLSGGNVVFSHVDPPLRDDSLGARLLKEKALTASVLAEAVEYARREAMPLGSVLVASGRVKKAAMHAALRAQTLDRLVSSLAFRGPVTVGPWREPELKGGLLAVPGAFVVTGLLRELVRELHGEAIAELFAPHPRDVAIVRVEGIGDEVGLRQRELLFFQRASQSSLPLSALSAATATTHAECLRYLVLGQALGIVSFARMSEPRPRSG